ncbi:putative Cytochrome P450 [Hibiscus syriacus]|uniref:Cytochrome P450 n=1 Tax=Hibiscus syriacus TaxID=106335 RepID=A0A6A3BLL8_HIBSY|nr:putative Cytochrome P450 [Hibiscus syriacus]
MAMVLFLNIFLLALFLLFFLLKHRIINNGKYCNLPLLPPGPAGLPFIGHLHLQMFDNSDGPHIFLWKLSQKYGSLMSLRFGFKPTLVVSSAKMAEKVMKTHDLDFCSRPNLRGTRKLSYEALDLAFSPYTDYWKEMRKICVVHLFSRVHKYRSIREDEVARLVEKIGRLSICSKPVNLSEAMMCLTSSIICRVGFGKRYDEEGAERSRFHGMLKESEAMFTGFSFADFFPFMGWVDRFTGFLNRLEKTFKEHDAFYQELVDEHLDPIGENQIKRT